MCVRPTTVLFHTYIFTIKSIERKSTHVYLEIYLG